MGNESKFYDGTELLSKRDAEGLQPELYIVCSKVRGVGKTTFFGRMLIDKALSGEGKFIMLCRKKQDVGHVAEGILKEVLALFYPDCSIEEKIGLSNVFSNVILVKGTGKEAIKTPIAYVISLAACDDVKKTSSMFTDATSGWFDEFMPLRKTTFLPDEVDCFLSVAQSVARGGGTARRYFPWYFTSNTMTINNPYFIELGLNRRIRDNTKWVKGNGYIFQRTESTEIADEHNQSGLSRAFNGNRTIEYTDDLSWLNDNYTLIDKPSADWGSRPMYYCTLCDGPKYTYGVYFYPDVNLYYVSCKFDKSAGLCFNIKYEDLKPNVPLLKTSIYMITLREAMQHGIIRFQTIRAKESFMNLFI